MRRRTLLRTVGAGFVGTTAGCLGGGGDVVASAQESIRVDPGHGWVTEIPDVSDPGGTISYAVRSDQGPFDVYFFVEDAAYEAYRSFIQGGDPDETPRGHDQYSKSVPAPNDGDMYVAETANEGSREPLDATGPYHFVVDHSNYRNENRVEDTDDTLSAFVDLTVTRKKFGI